MVSCVACGYSKTPKKNNSGVTFHRFPKDERRRFRWVSFVNKPGFTPNNRSLLCSKHFKEECFNRSSQSVIRLFPNAFPTIEAPRVKYVSDELLVRTVIIS
ncbi:THAP domain-containing protein 2-like [Coccinella septempunctata]|uniref:THAP domain-containing protein 2-like n=1 Tax=Coccinella septempunctata TaxID=41139 RepID=UPI001D066ABF|nr:THAP domain-containing protein 2-like [Coccinella septempunctata]XP_044753213.1 THAP domain-containing protein 2-like [Coccinella septempunctata]XP_044766510.1 THAP domain-containing protein 2-like [Coccinella septempunctata]